MILSPRFHEPTTVDRATERRALGLDPGTPLGLVMFGGQGSAQMKRIAQALDDRPLILLCGRNTRLLRTLAEMPARAPRQCVGFTSDVARWMRLADYFIGKPGPGSISEALHCGLPVIVTRNAWTMPQERWNTDWVGTQGLGKVLTSFAGIAAAVDELMADLEPIRARIAAIENQALFEIPRILAKVLETGRLTPSA
jgi:1,2-diacylglycerol 3-beta-galactosyltransferase